MPPSANTPSSDPLALLRWLTPRITGPLLDSLACWDDPGRNEDCLAYLDAVLSLGDLPPGKIESIGAASEELTLATNHDPSRPLTLKDHRERLFAAAILIEVMARRHGLVITDDIAMVGRAAESALAIGDHAADACASTLAAADDRLAAVDTLTEPPPRSFFRLAIFLLRAPRLTDVELSLAAAEFERFVEDDLVERSELILRDLGQCGSDLPDTPAERGWFLHEMVKTGDLNWLSCLASNGTDFAPWRRLAAAALPDRADAPANIIALRDRLLELRATW